VSAAPTAAPGVIAVVGEALVDLVPTGDEQTYAAVPGGSPANVAVGLARLGVRAQLLARIADDPFGRLVRRHLARNEVDLSHCVRAAERTSLAIVTRGEHGGGDEYDFRIDGTADWQWTDDELAKALDADLLALHAGSLGVTVEPGGPAVRRLLRRAAERSTVSYDPNCRPLLMGAPSSVAGIVRECMATADIVKASADDVGWLHPDRTPEDVAAEWLALGPAVVVVTLGPDGALATSRRTGLVRCAGVPVDVVDTVGAGDSFSSALLSGLLDLELLGADRRAALRGIDSERLLAVLGRAVRASAITASRRGADPPRLDDL
jgi:fructokinase